MELLNIAFAILIVKITLCVLPGIFGVFLIFSSQNTKRSLRNKVCSQLFGIKTAIPAYRFVRFLYVAGTFLALLSFAAVWFLIVKPYL